MDVEALLKELAKPDLLPEEADQQKKLLSQYINDLLLHDFLQLVQVLYRIDVPEEVLKTTLKQNPTKDAGELIANLLLQRQAEKLASKNNYRPSTDIPDEERW